MASKKEAKKDIRFLTEMVIIDAIELSEILTETTDKKKVYTLIAEVATAHNNLISRTNKPDGKDNRKMVKAHYKSIYTDLLQVCDEAYKKLQELTPAV